MRLTRQNRKNEEKLNIATSQATHQARQR